MVRILLVLFFGCWLSASIVGGRVTDGAAGLAGVRVHGDAPRRVRPDRPIPSVLTDASGAFSLDLDPGCDVLVVEKDGWQRDLVPRGDLARPIVLRPAPAFSREQVLVVRLDYPDQAPAVSDEALRALLFGERPGEASAASYVREVSKGSLLLEEGALLHLSPPGASLALRDEDRARICAWVLKALRGRPLGELDRVDNRTGAPRPDGKPDHLWIIPPGPPRSVTTDPAHLTAISFLEPLPWKPSVRWPLVFFTDETPLGFIVHEAFHAMGEHRVDDLYLGCEQPLTAGAWDLMDAGLFRGWEREHMTRGPWQEDTAASPSQPMGWVRAELWYRGRFRETVRTQVARGDWEGWMDPLVRAPGEGVQRLLVPDPRRQGRFWELDLRRGWGFDRGRVGGRWGPGFEGLVVARVDPGLLTLKNRDPRGPVRVLDAHPGTPEPPLPRYPCRRWELDDAAFALGPGEVAAGCDGPLSWVVLETDPSGRMKVRVHLERRGRKSRNRRP